MATDPVRRVHVDEVESGFITNAAAELQALAHLNPSLNTSYLSVYLDWRPDGRNPSKRVAETEFRNQVSALQEQFPSRSNARESFEADVEAIESFMTDGINPAAHGACIIANNGLDVFEVLEFAIPVETRVVAGPTPKLLPLVSLVEDNPRYAVLLADQLEASLLVISKASLVQSTSVTSSDYPRTKKKGGPSQKRYSNRRRERISHFARAVAGETSRTLWEEDIHLLIVAGDEVITSALNPEFDFRTREALLDTIRLDAKASYQDVISVTEPMIGDAEGTSEAEAIQHLRDAIGSNQLGVGGAQDVLRTLQRGKVSTLVMADDYHLDGWVDYELQEFGVGELPAEHPLGGRIENIHPTDLAEDMIWLAIMTGAEIELVHGENAAAMSEFNGVGAMLRWRTWG